VKSLEVISFVGFWTRTMYRTAAVSNLRRSVKWQGAASALP
jgi:hypothetical protein